MTYAIIAVILLVSSLAYVTFEALSFDVDA